MGGGIDGKGIDGRAERGGAGGGVEGRRCRWELPDRHHVTVTAVTPPNNQPQPAWKSKHSSYIHHP